MDIPGTLGSPLLDESRGPEPECQEPFKNLGQGHPEEGRAATA